MPRQLGRTESPPRYSRALPRPRPAPRASSVGTGLQEAPCVALHRSQPVWRRQKRGRRRRASGVRPFLRLVAVHGRRQDIARAEPSPSCRAPFPGVDGGSCRNCTRPRQRAWCRRRRERIIRVVSGGCRPQSGMSSPVRNVVALKDQITRRARKQSDGLALLPLVESPSDRAEAVGSDERADAPRLSVVVPAMNEEGNIGALHRAVADVLDAMGITFELILVDDGSSDGTWPTIEALSARDQ